MSSDRISSKAWVESGSEESLRAMLESLSDNGREAGFHVIASYGTDESIDRIVWLHSPEQGVELRQVFSIEEHEGAHRLMLETEWTFESELDLLEEAVELKLRPAALPSIPVAPPTESRRAGRSI